MKIIKLFTLLILVTCFLSCSQKSPSKQLQGLIDKYQTERKYEYDRFESVENTIRFYQDEANFSSDLRKELEVIPTENLSETDQISRELLLFVLQNKIDQHRFKTYLNPITSEAAFHLNLSQMANRKIEKAIRRNSL